MVLRKMVYTFTRYHWIWGFESPQRNWQYDTWEAWKAIIDWSHDLEACLMSCTSVSELLEQQQLNNALMKRLVAAVTDRKVYHDDWYLSEDPQSSFDPITNPNPPEKDIASALVAQGLIEDWNIAEAISNSFSQGLIGLPDGVSTVQDDVQTLNAKVDTLNSRFLVDNWIFPDVNIAQVLNDTLRVEGDFSDIINSVGKQWGIASLLKAALFVPTAQTGGVLAGIWDSIFGQPTTEIGLASSVVDELQNTHNKLSISKRSVVEAIDDQQLSIDTSNIEAAISAGTTQLANAIDALALCVCESPDTIQLALDKIASAIGEIEIINVLAGENARVAVKSDCCFDAGTTEATGTGDTTNTNDIWLKDEPYLPTITKDDYLVDDCTPTNINMLIEIIDALLGTFDWMVETFGMDIAKFLAPKILLFAARSSTSVAALLAGANLITVPDPSDAVTIGVTVAGIAFTAILEYVLAQIGIEGLILLLNYYKYDYDLFKAIECGDNDFEIDFPVNAKDYVKGLGKADEIAEMIGDAVRKILKLPPFKKIVK